MTSTIDPEKLVSTLAFALRHDPARFGLDIDDEGWTNLEDLVIAIRFDRYDWALVDEAALRTVIEGMDRVLKHERERVASAAQGAFAVGNTESVPADQRFTIAAYVAGGRQLGMHRRCPFGRVDDEGANRLGPKVWVFG